MKNIFYSNEHHASHENAAIETAAPTPPSPPRPEPTQPTRSDFYKIKEENSQLSQQLYLMSGIGNKFCFLLAKLLTLGDVVVFDQL